MTRPRRPQPRPRSFARVPRSRFDEHVAALEEQRDRAKGETRAQRDWIASWLEQRADAYRADAVHQERAVATDARMPGSTLTAAERRVIADELTQLALDVEGGPDHDGQSVGV